MSMPLKNTQVALDAELKSNDSVKSESIYTQTRYIFLTGKYDICCSIWLIFKKVKIVVNEVAARELSNARTVKRAVSAHSGWNGGDTATIYSIK